ncbi:MAG: nucleotidyl transferase AbiEii/AbiGii toxin family protein [Bacteroidetes bacterium]|nr:nucleotidyl transferase AbiEii/AbiGii toxin family protein [Bacteroidota bacterium]
MKLYYSTVSPLLLQTLRDLMSRKEFSMFRLVGGTALSLHRGHRISVDIDLFTDEDYGTVNFDLIEEYFNKKYLYVDTFPFQEIGLGRSYFIGENSDNCIKLDLYYTDKFIDDIVEVDTIRLASVGDIIAMKIDVILRKGRKKDFWDIDEIQSTFSIHQMAEFHRRRYPYSYDLVELKKKLTDFSLADADFDPVCLKGAHWELIKLDMIDLANEI